MIIVVLVIRNWLGTWGRTDCVCLNFYSKFLCFTLVLFTQCCIWMTSNPGVSPTLLLCLSVKHLGIYCTITFWWSISASNAVFVRYVGNVKTPERLIAPDCTSIVLKFIGAIMSYLGKSEADSSWCLLDGWSKSCYYRPCRGLFCKVLE